MADKNRVTIRDVYNLISDFRAEVKGQYVTKDEFNPVKRLVYGFVAAILIAVLAGILSRTLNLTVSAF